MSKKESNGEILSHGNCMGKQRLGRALTHSQEPRELPMSPVSTSSVMHTAHQRRWSADFSKCRNPHVITVKKNKKEPQTPQRRVSLVKPHAASDSLSKRYSCPPLGLLGSPSSSSSSSATSSCASPPPVQTSVITGPDPLGWKLRPKSSSTTTQARTNRLSLQISLPEVFPDHKSRPVPNSKLDNSLNQDPSLKIEPPLRAKPSRRHHSESSAFLRSLVTPLPVVTLEKLCGMHLRPVDHSDEPDAVFRDRSEVESKVAPQRKIPPPVPEKTFMARQIAQLIAQSLQPCAPVTMTTEADIYRSVMRPKPKQAQQTDLHAPKSGEVVVYEDDHLKFAEGLTAEGRRASHPDQLLIDSVCEAPPQRQSIITKLTLFQQGCIWTPVPLHASLAKKSEPPAFIPKPTTPFTIKLL